MQEIMITKYAILSPCGTHRYQLTRTWDESKKTVVFIMLNPSTADANIDDPTIKRCMSFAESWGYGQIVVLNLYSFRATDPKDLIKAHENGIEISDWKNIAHLENAKQWNCDIVFAWGSTKVLNKNVYEVIEMFPNAYCISKTKNGSPAHPLYLKKDLQLIKFKP